ncbi:MAG: hypothetical protein P4L51_07775, partial [Puia sp.]|nr:hypothetical protein [Puia sp.]
QNPKTPKPQNPADPHILKQKAEAKISKRKMGGIMFRRIVEGREFEERMDKARCLHAVHVGQPWAPSVRAAIHPG